MSARLAFESPQHGSVSHSLGCLAALGSAPSGIRTIPGVVTTTSGHHKHGGAQHGCLPQQHALHHLASDDAHLHLHLNGVWGGGEEGGRGGKREGGMEDEGVRELYAFEAQDCSRESIRSAILPWIMCSPPSSSTRSCTNQESLERLPPSPLYAATLTRSLTPAALHTLVCRIRRHLNACPPPLLTLPPSLAHSPLPPCTPSCRA